ncbi:hypothetical protein K1719_045274 [Acacia pycnantha]|nr:hypothetical protein K1719_045274 [Acacia pycnantha]
MDPNLSPARDFRNGHQIDDGAVFSGTNQYLNLGDDWDEDHQTALNYYRYTFHQPEVDPLSYAPHTSLISEEALPNPSWSASSVEGVPDVLYSAATSAPDPSLDDYDFSESIKYMSQVLMEENLEQKPSMFYDPLSLKLTEKSFYDALRHNDSLSPNEHPLIDTDDSPDGHFSETTTDSSTAGGGGGTSTSTSTSTNTSPNDLELRTSSPETPVLGDYSFQFKSQSISQQSSQPPNASTNISDGLLNLDSSITQLLAQNIFSDAESVSQFNRGLEEASKFLPRRVQLVTGLESTAVSVQSKVVRRKAPLNTEKWARENLQGLKGRKNHDRDGSVDEEEGRSKKQSAVYVDESELSEMFDKVLLSVENVPLCSEHESVHCGSAKDLQTSEQAVESSDGEKTHSKKQGRKKETVDLNTLLVLCAQAVSASDRRTAHELLKQIRQHSSPLGDASQRVAHYFANGLEARLVGVGAGTQLFYTS